MVNYASSPADAERVVQDIQERGASAIAVQGDVSVPADVERLFARTMDAYGRFDVLVNNAGVYYPQPLETVVDVALGDYPQVWAAGGTPHTVFPTTFDELVRITGGTALVVGD